MRTAYDRRRGIELLERDTAVEALEGALAQARGGAGRIVLVAGEAGVGKTALAERVARAASERARLCLGRGRPAADAARALARSTTSPVRPAVRSPTL